MRRDTPISDPIFFKKTFVDAGLRGLCSLGNVATYVIDNLLPPQVFKALARMHV